MKGVGQIFPDFELKAVVSREAANPFEQMNLKTVKEPWKVFFFWPKDFTFVCPTEIAAFNSLYDEFKERDAALIGASTDSEFVHLAWQNNHEDLKEIKFPWLSDIKRELCSELGILDEKEGVALRATYIVDPDNIIRFVGVNDLAVGRSPEEILRVLDALQTDELCPCNWKKGEPTLKAA